MRTFKTVDEIKKERLLNRENKTIYNLLSTLLGELDRRPNQNIPVAAEDIYKNIKKLYEASIECGNDIEKEYLENFIKKQLSEDELRDVIKGIVEGSGINNIGGIMKYLNINYAGQFDGRVASTLAREYIAKR